MPIIDFSMINEASLSSLRKEEASSNYFEQLLKVVMDAKKVREIEEVRKKETEPTIADMLQEMREDIRENQKNWKNKFGLTRVEEDTSHLHFDVGYTNLIDTIHFIRG